MYFDCYGVHCGGCVNERLFDFEEQQGFCLVFAMNIWSTIFELILICFVTRCKAKYVYIRDDREVWRLLSDLILVLKYYCIATM